MSDKHTLHVFDEDLRVLREEVANLANQVGTELERALQALMSSDRALAQEVIDSDTRADSLQTQIQMHMSRTLARQQAMAQDLREILAAGRIATHLERIGDYAKNTAKRSLRLAQPVDAEISAQCHWMMERVRSMLHRVMEAYDRDDAELANVTWSSDAELDAMYGKLFEHLLLTMSSNSATIKDGTQLLFIAKGMERAGDHVTDIAEEIYLMVTGKPLQGPRPKVDEPSA